ncbi:MAG: UDP-glucose 4-epimerase, partial [Anaerolineae bacterium]|nr:UDP-glucose 4-epimerase [Anaerolineae bacterium]
KRPNRLYVPKGLVCWAAGLLTGVTGFVGKPMPFEALLAKYLEDVAVDGQKIQQNLGFEPAFDLVSGWQDVVRQKPPP